ncbi:MAG: YbjQ family protein [Flavobacteriales bacterium]|nr:YbjQ family protein [Flavobacteriales bacterium]
MILTTTETLPNREINEVKGIARGSTVRTRNVGRDILAGFKNLVGGEIEEYTKLQADAREQALQRMKDDAAKYGADAIVNVRFTTSVITQAASEVLAYGTAVTLK